jgi:hypothetical protein
MSTKAGIKKYTAFAIKVEKLVPNICCLPPLEYQSQHPPQSQMPSQPTTNQLMTKPPAVSQDPRPNLTQSQLLHTLLQMQNYVQMLRSVPSNQLTLRAILKLLAYPSSTMSL